jgi:hypothetical protein
MADAKDMQGTNTRYSQLANYRAWHKILLRELRGANKKLAKK